MARAKEKFVPVDSVEIARIAKSADIPVAHLRAVAVKESSDKGGVYIGGTLEPLFRFEGHIFDRSLDDGQRSIARKLGLASTKIGGVKNPVRFDDRQKLLLRAANVNKAAAYEATSWGFGQIMGFHWKTLGLRDVFELVAIARSGQAGQATLMLMFLKKAGLDDELREGQWKAFARGYNGPQYARNKYDVAIKALAEKFANVVTGDKVVTAQPDGMLRMGHKGPKVRELQVLLGRTGAVVKVDGDFGPTTRDAVKGFQTSAGLKADGVVGPETYRRLNEYRTSATDKPGSTPILSIPAVQKGGAAVVASAITLPNLIANSGINAESIAVAKAGLETAAGQIVGAGIQSVALDYLVNGLTIGAAALGAAGAVYALYGYFKPEEVIEG